MKKQQFGEYEALKIVVFSVMMRKILIAWG